MVTIFETQRITVPELWGEMCIARLFSHGVNHLAFIFYLRMVVPHQIFLASRNQTHCGTNTPLRFLTLTQWHWVWLTDGQTDGGIYRSIYTALVARCRNGCMRC